MKDNRLHVVGERRLETEKENRYEYQRSRISGPTRGCTSSPLRRTFDASLRAEMMQWYLAQPFVGPSVIHVASNKWRRVHRSAAWGSADPYVLCLHSIFFVANLLRTRLQHERCDAAKKNVKTSVTKNPV